MNILITGGDGFLAKELRYYFERDNEHEIYARNRYELPLLDKKKVNDWFTWNHDKVDVVIHTAALGGDRLNPDNKNVFFDNIEMFKNIYTNCQKYNLLLINFTSGAEDYPGYYGYAKKVITSICDETKENVINLKIWNCFGFNGLDTRFIEGNINNYINKSPIVIHRDRLFDFFYSEDVYKIIKYFLIKKENNEIIKSQKISCVYPEILSLEDVGKIINQLSYYKVEIIKENNEWDAAYCEINMFKRYEFLDYIGIKEGIRKVYTYKVRKKMLNLNDF